MMRGGCHGAARTDLFELRRVAHYKPDKNPVRTTEKPPGERFALNITSLLLRGRYYCSDMGGGVEVTSVGGSARGIKGKDFPRIRKYENENLFLITNLEYEIWFLK